jgi:hypothetical protein
LAGSLFERCRPLSAGFLSAFELLPVPLRQLAAQDEREIAARRLH